MVALPPVLAGGGICQIYGFGRATVVLEGAKIKYAYSGSPRKRSLGDDVVGCSGTINNVHSAAAGIITTGRAIGDDGVGDINSAAGDNKAGAGVTGGADGAGARDG